MTTAYEKCQHCDAVFRGDPHPRHIDENAVLLLRDHMRQAHAELTFECPRQVENWRHGGERAFWETEGTCSYCGSVSQARLFAAIDAGAEIGPTDKSYKIYVANREKFYFQHLDDDGRERFIRLHNEKKMKIGYPGHFYVRPFFCKVMPADAG